MHVMSRIDHHVALASVHGVWNPALVSYLAEQAGAPVRRRQLPSATCDGGQVLLEEVVIDHWGRAARVSSFATFDLQAMIEASRREPFDLVVLMLLPSEASRFDWPALVRGWHPLTWRGAANLLILSRAELDDDALAGLRAGGLGVHTLACGLRDHALAWQRIAAFLVAPEIPETPASEQVFASAPASDESGCRTGAIGKAPVMAGLVSHSWLDDGGSSPVGPGRPSTVKAYLEPLLQMMDAIEPDDRIEELIITSTTRTEVILHMPAEAGSGYAAAEFDRDEISPALARLLAHDLATTGTSGQA